MKIIDLCSGLGGFSQAFLNRGHDVIRIDNNPKFKDVPHTTIMDIRYIRNCGLDIHPGKVDILLMSPPCNHFSLASTYIHWSKTGIPTKETVCHIRIVYWCLDAVDYLRPKYWLIENPRGQIKRVLGEPDWKIYLGSYGAMSQKPTYLYGKLPDILFRSKPTHISKGAGCGKKGRDLRPSDPSERAVIPYELSKALCMACEKEIGGGNATSL